MYLAGFWYLFFARWFFKWMIAWPALFLYRFFPPPSPDQIFPMLGSNLGILSTLGVSTLTYSLLSYIVLSFISASRHLVGPTRRERVS